MNAELGQRELESADALGRESYSNRFPQPVKLTYLIGSLARGGAEGQLLQLLAKLDPARWETSLVVFDGLYKERVPEMVSQVLSLGISSGGCSRSYFKGWRAAQAIRRLIGHLRCIRPNILHAFLPAACILAAPAAKLARVPVLIGSRRSLVDSYRTGGVVGRVDRLATRMCDFVLGNSAAVTGELIRTDGVPAERALTIHNGVDIAKFKAGDRSLRAVYGWSEEHVVFGIVANFLAYKRHTDFVRAAVRIAAYVPHARFLMAGEDRGMLPAVRREIAQAGLETRFVIIPGTPEPQQLYPAMDAYICTSETEGFSNVLLEAAASRLPLIATRVGGNVETVFPRENGFLVPVGRPQDVAEAALTLVGDPILRRRMGERSRELVKQRFSLETMVRQHEQLYERALELRRRSVLANIPGTLRHGARALG